MPALLAPSPKSQVTAEAPRDERGAGACAPNSSKRAHEWLAGVACLVLALLIAGATALPLAPVVLRAGDAVRLALLGSATNMLRGTGAVPGGAASVGISKGDTTADACTQGDRDVFGASVVVERDAWVCGHVTTYGGNVTVLGHVDGDVRAVGGSVQVSGQVGGSVTAVGGNVDLETGSHVEGDVQAYGGTVNANANIFVRGQIQPSDSLDRLRQRGGLDPFTPGEFPWFRVLFWALVAAALGILAPRSLASVRAQAQAQPVQSLVTGLLAIALGAIATVALVVSCLGIPLAVALVGVLWLGWMIGTVALGLWLGEAILRGLGQGHPSPLFAAVLGTTIFGALEAVPYAGWPVGIAVGGLGLGASLRAFAAARQKSRALRQRA
jgi:hypothetical protein